MKKYFHSIIDASFIIDFCNQKPTDIEADDPSIVMWIDLMNFLRHRTEIDLDITDSLMIDEYEPSYYFLKDLIDKSSQGDESIRINYRVRQDLAPNQLDDMVQNSNFIFYNDIDQYFLSNLVNAGVYYFNSNEILKNWKTVIRREKLSIIKGDSSNIGSFRKWEDFRTAYSHPFNSIILVDNYLCTDYYNIENNLIPLLVALIPQEQTTLIDLMIITAFFYKQKNTGLEVDIDEINKTITIKLNNAFKNKNIRLSIIKCKVKEVHDRHIYTNYFTITSGNSFSYFDRHGNIQYHKKTVYIVADSLVEYNKEGQTNAEYYNDFLKYIKNVIIKGSTEHTNYTENRLLEKL